MFISRFIYYAIPIYYCENILIFILINSKLIEVEQMCNMEYGWCILSLWLMYIYKLDILTNISVEFV